MIKDNFACVMRNFRCLLLLVLVPLFVVFLGLGGVSGFALSHTNTRRAIGRMISEGVFNLQPLSGDQSQDSIGSDRFGEDFYACPVYCYCSESAEEITSDVHDYDDGFKGISRRIFDVEPELDELREFYPLSKYPELVPMMKCYEYELSERRVGAAFAGRFFSKLGQYFFRTAAVVIVGKGFSAYDVTNDGNECDEYLGETCSGEIKAKVDHEQCEVLCCWSYWSCWSWNCCCI